MLPRLGSLLATSAGSSAGQLVGAAHALHITMPVPSRAAPRAHLPAEGTSSSWACAAAAPGDTQPDLSQPKRPLARHVALEAEAEVVFARSEVLSGACETLCPHHTPGHAKQQFSVRGVIPRLPYLTLLPGWDTRWSDSPPLLKTARGMKRQ